MTHEVDTYQIIETAIKQNKKVYVPETNYKEGLMTFKRLLSLNEIEKDDKGIYHSISDSELTNYMDLLVVPGVAFEKVDIELAMVGAITINFKLIQNANC